MSGGEKNGPKRRWRSAAALEGAVDAYFAGCVQEERFPSVTGLALELGFDCRGDLEERAAVPDRTGGLLRRACSRVEEANIQAAYRRDSASGARFLLQSGFGYSDKKEVKVSGGVIQVNLTDEEEE